MMRTAVALLLALSLPLAAGAQTPADVWWRAVVSVKITGGAVQLARRNADGSFSAIAGQSTPIPPLLTTNALGITVPVRSFELTFPGQKSDMTVAAVKLTLNCAGLNMPVCQQAFTVALVQPKIIPAGEKAVLRYDATPLTGPGSISVLRVSEASTPPLAPAPAPVPTPAPGPILLASSIGAGAVLSGKAIVWTATPARGSATPSSIDFLIDGAARWTEKTAPYQFNGDPAGLLDTTALANGAHTLALVATYPDGTKSTLTIAVTVQN